MQPIKYFIDNRSGFTLMETLVSVGILGIITLAVFSLVQLGFSNGSRIDQSVAAYDLEDLARTYLKSQASCQQTFKGLQIDPTKAPDPSYVVSITGIRGPAPVAGAAGPIVLPEPNPFRQAAVVSTDLRNFRLMGSNSSARSYLANVRILSLLGARPDGWIYDPSVALPQGLRQRMTDIPVFFVSDLSGNFLSCGVGYGDLSKAIADDMCSQFGGVKSPSTGLCLSGGVSPVRRQCPRSSIVSGIAADGTVSCQTLPSLKGCVVGSVVQKISADGSNAKCITIYEATH